MTVGFSSVGEYAVGELESSVPFIPVLTPPLFTLVALAPTIRVGVTIDVPAATITLHAVAPILQTGIRLDMPVGVVSLSGQAPQILFSANVLVSAPVHIVLSAPSGIDINGGGLVDNPSRQDSFVSAGGGVAEFSVGQFGVGEGAGETSLSARRAARLVFTARAPQILAGTLIAPPAASLSLLARVPEVDSRGRKIRAYAILS